MAARPAAPLAWALLLLSGALFRGGCRGRFAAEPDSEDDAEEALVFPESPLQRPTVLVVVLARNAAHTLPHFLGCLERLDYPKDRMAIWAATDHNVDNTTEILREWLKNVQRVYHYVEWRPMDEPESYPDEIGPKHWAGSRFAHVMKLRQAALRTAREKWSDYILFIDVDNFLTNPQTLNLMMAENKTIVAPMLESRGLYSNFWCGITPQGFYKRTPDYLQIREWKRLGCFPVPMVHSTFLIDLRKEASDQLAFYPPHQDYTWAFDDIMVFAFSSRQAGIQMYLCNREHYGYLPIPLKPHQTLQEDVENFVHVQTEAMIDGPPMEPSQFVSVVPKYPDKMGFDEIFMINLKRRKDRRDRMLRTLYEQEIEVKIVEAVDGKALNTSQLKALNIEMLPGYRDPYSSRPLTRGEIGCFLSHYSVWKEVIDRELEKALVIEDDVRFEHQFKKKLMTLMDDIDRAQLDWELIYIGRKRMQVKGPEKAVPHVAHLVEADYSYWTLGYAISLEGAQKLVGANPFGKMLPVDEFLPIMYNKHPVAEYMEHYESRDLKAFSAEPLLIYPTHYTGQPGYLSDTETSTIWDNETVATDWDRTHAWKSRKQAHIPRGGKNTEALPPPTSLDTVPSKDEL
ncbi:procollagen galactosyltransferase 2 isoform X1 [Camelus dromedarius]|uniref:Procollagen galactosyltransferase 2 isoform X1 n=4 Tax=Camelus TaxID=9836 RepID=A0A8B8RQ22_CAMFR|nr:procollagen galactosyltransferase 2 isoform X1 [Camelus dromedarius]XP_032319440.1 procollagen galactosyltransferase 2 isoform X1 [Camelus ferus]